MNRVRRIVLAGLMVGGGWVAVMAATASAACLTGPATSAFTGAEQCYEVPAGVTLLTSGPFLTGLTLTGDTLSWSHDGSPRTVQLTPP